MPRIARIIIPDIPHHITQRGNRGENVFFQDSDKKEYLKLLQAEAVKNKVDIWAYCLMDNHVHFVAVPRGKEEGLARTFAETHRKYTRYINFQKGWRGHLWQDRFASFPMDETYLQAAIRYVENNPVKAKIVDRAQNYPFSSAKSHITKQFDPILSRCFLDEEIPDWCAYLSDAKDDDEYIMQKHAGTGRPLGDDEFINKIESMLNRKLTKQKPGPKPKSLTLVN